MVVGVGVCGVCVCGGGGGVCLGGVAGDEYVDVDPVKSELVGAVHVAPGVTRGTW